MTMLTIVLNTILIELNAPKRSAQGTRRNNHHSVETLAVRRIARVSRVVLVEAREEVTISLIAETAVENDLAKTWRIAKMLPVRVHIHSVRQYVSRGVRYFGASSLASVRS